MALFHNRREYLEQLGLKYDPFRASVAEQDYKLSLENSRQIAEYYAYFFSPTLQTQGGDSLSLLGLRQAQHMMIYGKAGDGKTALRLNLEAHCRNWPDKTLVANFPLGRQTDLPWKDNEYAAHLARHLALEAFIQILEQFASDQPLDEHRRTALSLIVQWGGTGLNRLINTIVDQPQPSSFAGIAAYWPLIGKNAVKYTTSWPVLIEELKRLIQAPNTAVLADGWEGVTALWQAVQSWGYKHLILLVDGVDGRTQDAQKMLTWLTPLLDRGDVFMAQGIALKLFLPDELKPVIDSYLKRHPLQPAPINVKIRWSDQAIEQVLIERFKAAGARIADLQQLAEPGFEDQLESRLFAEAGQSPRRALERFSALIDAHVINHRHKLELDEADWRLAQDMRLPQDALYAT